MKKRSRSLLYGILALSMAPLCCGFTEAALPDNYDSGHIGSIRISLEAPGDPVASVVGAEVTIYRVAELGVRENKFVYTYTSEFSGYDETLYIADPELAASIETYAVSNGIKGKSLVTNEYGVALFEGLRTGVYLCTETRGVEGFTEFEPFLISMPEALGRIWNYNVSAEPKIEIGRMTDITVKKVWNDNGDNRPASIQAQLCKGEKVYDTVTLSDENEWTHTWKDIPYRDDWSVREVDVPKGYTVSYRQNEMEFEICNTQTLIQTGQLNWPVPLLACGGIALLIGGLALKLGGRKREDGCK